VLPDSPKTGRFAKIARIALQVLERSKLGSFQESTNTYSTGAIWTGWYVGARNDQRTQNKADAESKGYNRREVLAPTGAALWVDRTAWRDGNAQRVVVGKQPLPVWSAFPLQLKNEKAPEVGFTRVVARTELEQMPPADQAVDPQGNRWWRLNVRTTSTDPSNNMFSGAWVCEKGHEKVSWQSPWAWPGFEFVEEGGIEPIDLAASNYHRTGTAEPDERKDFKTRADKVDKSVLVKKLYEFIDQNKDDEVDAQELKKAFQQPLLAQALTRIIAQYESEWGGEMAKWNELDPLMLDDKADWEAEKLRIDQLRWWPKVAAKVKGFPSSPLAYHFHPIGLINNFMSRSAGCCEITVEFLEKVLGKSGTWFNGKGGGKLFEERFKTNYPAVYKMDKAKFVTMLNEALDRHEINECYQKAHFLAQCFHECAHFETTLEFGSGKNYDPGVHGDAEKNGNTKVGDGPRYRGRGLIQLTWKNNYKKYSDYRGIDFTANPELIASDMYNSIDASCWYWRHNGTIHKKHDAKGDINKLIAAEKNNVTLITLAVNGGDNGLAERKSLFATIKTEWGLK
jgi:predicted chitinase